MSLLTAKEAALLLRIATSTIYQLAAPTGPIPSHRFGGALRFEEDDLREYKKLCRYTTTQTPVAGAIHLTASSTEKGSVLQSYFQKIGVEPKLKNMSKRKRRDSSP